MQLNQQPRTVWVNGLQPLYLNKTGCPKLDALMQYIAKEPRQCVRSGSKSLGIHIETNRKQYKELVSRKLIVNVQDPIRRYPQKPAIYEIVK